MTTQVSTASTPTLPEALARLTALEAEVIRLREQAATAIQQREAVLAHLPAGVLLLDGAGRVVLLNEEYCRQLGLALPATQWLGLSALALAGQVQGQFDDPAGFVEGSRRVWQRQQVERGTALRLTNGRVLERDAQPVAYGGGTGMGFLVSYRDVTDRSRAEEALREVSRVPAENPSPILRLSATGHRLYANAACRHLQSRISSAAHRSLYAGLQAAAAAAFSARQPQRQQVTADAICFQVDVVPVLAEEYVNLYLVDVTEREQARQALATEQAFTRQVFDAIPSVVYVRDATRTFQFQNRATERLLAEADFATPPPLGSVRAAELAHYAALDAQVLTLGDEVCSEDRLTMPDGSVRWYQSVKRPLTRPDGTVQVLGVSTDITLLKAAQHAAEAAATARQHFLANMSHEIRTPLNGVLGLTSQLAKTRLDPQQQHLLGVVRRSGQHLLAVLNDVLDLAKISSGKLELEQVPFDLCQAMETAVQPLALAAVAKGLTFVGLPLRASCPYPWVVGDAPRLTQILVNLVGNALKFTERGTITVAGELLAETETTLSVCFRVTDTGIGIAPAQQARIFESFTQAYADTTRQYGGTGLGLSISRALVAQLGGTLTLESELGRGSTFAFTVTLPRVPAPAPHTEGDAYDTGRLRGCRVLLVEDSSTNRLVTRLILASWGIKLDEAPNGPAGLACLEAGHYDLVLMDIQLPGLSGVAVTQRLRQLPDPVRSATPVLALTANAFREDSEYYLAAGLNDCLVKPFDERVLYAKMAALCQVPIARYDLTLLRRQAQGRPAFVTQILHSVLTHMPASLVQLRAAAAAGRWPEAAEVAHHLKPTLVTLAVGGIGPALALLARCHRAAPAGLAPTPEALAAAVQHLTTATERVLAELPAELAELEVRPGGPAAAPATRY